ncbi:ester cyclase [Nocardia sp. NPDC052278]|uniref:ester cyclase n=1 Tax=unclassified Nocardia TaxID=2637762 RepID=UPI0036C5BCC1
MTTTEPIEHLPVTEAFIRSFGRRWLDAWNSHDTDQVLELLHPDILWDEQVFWPTPLRGREAVRAYVDAIWKAMPDVHFEEVQTFSAPADGRGLFMFHQSGGAPEQFGATDKTFATTGCDIFLAFDEGLLSHYTAAFDIVGMLRQLGALPPRGDKNGGAYLMSIAHRP